MGKRKPATPYYDLPYAAGLQLLLRGGIRILR